jgi:hypothetical protein
MPCGKRLYEEEKFFHDPNEFELEITTSTNDVDTCKQCISIHGSNVFNINDVKYINCAGIYVRLDKNFK